MKRIIWDEDFNSFVEYKNPEKKVNAKLIESTPKNIVSKILENSSEIEIQKLAPNNATYYSIGNLYICKKFLIQYYEPNN